METRYAPREHPLTLPAINIDDGNRSGRFGYPTQLAPSLASIPMTIPHTSEHHHAPPPLPPPRYVPVNGPDSIAAEAYRPREMDHAEELPHYKSRIDRDEGYHSLESPLSRGPFSGAPHGMYHDHFQFRSSSDAYDNSLLKKLDSKRSRDTRSPPRRSGLSHSARDPPRLETRYNLPTHSLPHRSKQSSLLESPGRYTETPMHSAVSPHSAAFSHTEYRSPHEVMDFQRSPILRNRRTNSGSIADDAVSTQGSYENGEDVDFPMEETSRLQDFHIDSALTRPTEYQTTGQKRRASSPLIEEAPMLHSIPSASDLLRRRDIISRGSPTPRLSVIPQGSISSVSSVGRSNSYASNLSLTASSVTSMNSFSADRRSPGGMSPTDTASCKSPYATPTSLTTSPRSSVSRTPHIRNISDHSRALMSPRKLSDMSKVGSKRQGFFMCECCPKKPKKFDTAEELSVHEKEKQYECTFCGNRFKNKNEAERHQNSLHVRRHSWSCSALRHYDRAFHESTTRPGEADTCGYCGTEFDRNGPAIGRSMGRECTDRDWDERARHLQEVHKFRECNSSKKFFRADHFRQHLKHSHAGTSGKWTNMLENACMLEEEPPVPNH